MEPQQFVLVGAVNAANLTVCWSKTAFMPLPAVKFWQIQDLIWLNLLARPGL
jgi:hypothetical protein